MQQLLGHRYSHTCYLLDPPVAQHNRALLPIVDVESIFDSRLRVDNYSLSCLGDPDPGLGRMALLR